MTKWSALIGSAVSGIHNHNEVESKAQQLVLKNSKVIDTRLMQKSFELPQRHEIHVFTSCPRFANPPEIAFEYGFGQQVQQGRACVHFDWEEFVWGGNKSPPGDPAYLS